MVRGSSHGSYNEHNWYPFSSYALAALQPLAGYTPTHNSMENLMTRPPAPFLTTHPHPSDKQLTYGMKAQQLPGGIRIVNSFAGVQLWLLIN